MLASVLDEGGVKPERRQEGRLIMIRDNILRVSVDLFGLLGLEPC